MLTATPSQSNVLEIDRPTKRRVTESRLSGNSTAKRRLNFGDPEEMKVHQSAKARKASVCPLLSSDAAKSSSPVRSWVISTDPESNRSKYVWVPANEMNAHSNSGGDIDIGDWEDDLSFYPAETKVSIKRRASLVISDTAVTSPSPASLSNNQPVDTPSTPSTSPSSYGDCSSPKKQDLQSKIHEYFKQNSPKNTRSRCQLDQDEIEVPSYLNSSQVRLYLKQEQERQKINSDHQVQHDHILWSFEQEIIRTFECLEKQKVSSTKHIMTSLITICGRFERWQEQTLWRMSEELISLRHIQQMEWNSFISADPNLGPYILELVPLGVILTKWDFVNIIKAIQ